MKPAQSPATRHWLVKTEPETYSWLDFVRDRSTAWTGVRNYAARLNLKPNQSRDPHSTRCVVFACLPACLPKPN